MIATYPQRILCIPSLLRPRNQLKVPGGATAFRLKTGICYFSGWSEQAHLGYCYTAGSVAGQHKLRHPPLTFFSDRASGARTNCLDTFTAEAQS